MTQQEIITPGEHVTTDALMYALQQRDALQVLLNQTHAELVQHFDQLGYTLKRLGLLENSEFWQKYGPIDPGTVLTKSNEG